MWKNKLLFYQITFNVHSNNVEVVIILLLWKEKKKSLVNWVIQVDCLYSFRHLEDNVEKNTQSEKQKEKKNKNKQDNLRYIWENMKHYSICLIGVLGEEREQGIENLFEGIITENFSNLVKEKDTQVQKAQRIPSKMNPKSPTPRHIIIKMVKDKERILKATMRKTMSYLQWSSHKTFIRFINRNISGHKRLARDSKW